MGKNHRHKKDLKAEKAKVKLKQTKTKFLPKGQNVTNVAFKIKPIILLEQLKVKDSDDILSKRKLNIKDLLSRLKHYNDNIKHSACEELNDMVQIYHEEIVQHQFSEICLTLGSLMQDREHKVRKSAAKVIDTVLQYIPSEKVKPFLHFFSTNLRCAMTNINRNIQEDSLLFLDCFIRVDCGLIRDNSERLLPEFFTLISKLRGDSQLERTLTLNLGSNMTSVAWRIKVLSRLHAVLSVLLAEEGSKTTETESLEGFDASKQTRFPIYKSHFDQVLSDSKIDFTSNSKTSFHHGATILNRHVGTLIPLLYETWLEAVPDKFGYNPAGEGTVLNNESAALLSCIVNTLHLLWRYIHHEDTETAFMSMDCKKFLNHLLAGFPYTHPGARTKQKSKNATLKILDYNTDPKCVRENLLICFLYSALFINYSQKDIRKDLLSIVTYVTKVLFQKKTIGEDSADCIMQILEECLYKNHAKWRRSGVDLRMIVDNAVMFFNHGKISDAKRLKVFEVLSQVVDNPQLNKTDKYQYWLSSLPEILCKAEVNDNIISALLDLSKKNSPVFYNSFLKKLSQILDNLDKIKIILTDESLTNNEESCKRKIAYIFYYVPAYSKSDLDLISKHLQNNPASGFRKYMEQIFLLRLDLGREKEWPSQFLEL